MQLRSLDTLDLPLAWRRVLNLRRRPNEVPDRLPYEVLDRITEGSPPIEAEHHLRPVLLVMANKRSGTVRPFVRVSPVDLMLYQALVDALAPDIELALGDRTKIQAFRQNLIGSDDPFHGSPTWTDFIAGIHAELEMRGRGYVLTADVASYFVYVDVDELERRLLEVCRESRVVRDLGELLRGWRQLGVRGLPQGVPPSSPLGNFYLRPVDQALESWGTDHRRYMDDLWCFTESYSAARRLQDRLERLLYEDRLGFGGDKLKIRRTSTALRDSRTAAQELQERRESTRLEFLSSADDPYASDEDWSLAVSRG
jgi:hypothetical protein